MNFYLEIHHQNTWLFYSHLSVKKEPKFPMHGCVVGVACLYINLNIFLNADPSHSLHNEFVTTTHQGRTDPGAARIQTHRALPGFLRRDAIQSPLDHRQLPPPATALRQYRGKDEADPQVHERVARAGSPAGKEAIKIYISSDFLAP